MCRNGALAAMRGDVGEQPPGVVESETRQQYGPLAEPVRWHTLSGGRWLGNRHSCVHVCAFNPSQPNHKRMLPVNDVFFVTYDLQDVENNGRPDDHAAIKRAFVGEGSHPARLIAAQVTHQGYLVRMPGKTVDEVRVVVEALQDAALEKPVFKDFDTIWVCHVPPIKSYALSSTMEHKGQIEQWLKDNL